MSSALRGHAVADFVVIRSLVAFWNLVTLVIFWNSVKNGLGNMTQLKKYQELYAIELH